MGGKNNKWNLVYLCPTCHSSVYDPEAKSGIHSKKGMNSFQIIGWKITSNGRLVECKNVITGEYFYI